MNCLVWDVGKTNIRASVISPDGSVLGSLSRPNQLIADGPYPRADHLAAKSFLMEAIRTLNQQFGVDRFIATTHGSYGFLLNRRGEVVALPDYEAALPQEIADLYQNIADRYLERGSGIAGRSSHLARQLLWIEQKYPEVLAESEVLLPGPQFWGWIAGGRFAADPTSLAAQSHLWNVQKKEITPLVKSRGWERLIPPISPSWNVIGTVRPQWVSELGLRPDTKVHCGVHDSTANFHRFQALDLRNFSLISTGTWFVTMNDKRQVDEEDEQFDLTIQTDVDGGSIASVRAMCGREYAILTDGDPFERADNSDIQKILGSRTYALPSFVPSSGFNPHAGGKGHTIGPPPETQSERHALATVYAALMADLSLDRIGSGNDVIVDGVFAKNIQFTSLLAQLRPDQQLYASDEVYGTALGAAILTYRNDRPNFKSDLKPVIRPEFLGLNEYRSEWRHLLVHRED